MPCRSVALLVCGPCCDEAIVSACMSSWQCVTALYDPDPDPHPRFSLNSHMDHNPKPNLHERLPQAAEVP